jgi:hypothetical protein
VETTVRHITYPEGNRVVTKYLVGYGLSLFVGTIVTYYWSKWLHTQIQKYKTDDAIVGDRVVWLPATIGILERVVYTVLVAYSVSGAASFIGAWITIKAVGGWAHWSQDRSTYGRCLFSAGLLGSGMSALFGIVGGLIASQ